MKKVQLLLEALHEVCVGQGAEVDVEELRGDLAVHGVADIQSVQQLNHVVLAMTQPGRNYRMES